jgi:hypothetical protein
MYSTVVFEAALKKLYKIYLKIDMPHDYKSRIKMNVALQHRGDKISSEKLYKIYQKLGPIFKCRNLRNFHFLHFVLSPAQTERQLIIALTEWVKSFLIQKMKSFFLARKLNGAATITITTLRHENIKI